MAEFFEKGESVPSDWYEASNLKPFVFGVPVMVEIVGGERHIMPRRPLENGETVLWSDGAINPKEDSPINADPPWHIFTV